MVKEAVLPKQTVAFAVHVLGEASYHLGLRRSEIDGNFQIIHWDSGAAHASGHYWSLAYGVESELQRKGQRKNTVVRPGINNGQATDAILSNN